MFLNQHISAFSTAENKFWIVSVISLYWKFIYLLIFAVESTKLWLIVVVLKMPGNHCLSRIRKEL